MPARVLPCPLVRLAGVVAVAACALAYVAPAAAGRQEPQSVLVRGRVLDREGWPVAGVTVMLLGSRTASTATDADGRFGLRFPLGTAEEIAREPLAVRITPQREGWVFRRPGGMGVPGLEIEIVGGPARARIQAADAAFARAVAALFASRTQSIALVGLDFVGGPGTSDESQPVDLSAQEEVPVPGVKVAKPVGPARPGTIRAPTRADSLRSATSGPGASSGAPPAPVVPKGVVGPPGSPTPVLPTGSDAPIPVVSVPAPASPAASDTCRCRVKGTVEVSWARPLLKRLRVTVGVAGLATVRDTPELFMGSPRPFEMLVPCGTRRLTVVPEARMRFVAGPPVMLKEFDCAPGVLRQFRIVLEPR